MTTRPLGALAFRAGVAIAVAQTLFFAGSAMASFHLWRVNEVFSSPDGSVQFIEFKTDSDFQEFVGGQPVDCNQTGGPGANTITIALNLPSSSTAGRTFLIATAGFASLSNSVTPDYIMPSNFLFRAGGSVGLRNATFSTPFLTYGPLPADGRMAIDRTGASVTNSPKNFAGVSGSVFVPPPLPASLPPENLRVAMGTNGFVPRNVTVVAGDAVLWTNLDAAAHTTTSGTSPTPDGLWDSGALALSASFRRTFDQPGEYPYFSTNDAGNSNFTAVIRVIGSNEIRITDISLSGGNTRLKWTGPDTRKFDLLFRRDLASTSVFELAQANIPPDGDGTNILAEPPFMASARFDANSNLFYQIRSRVSTQMPLAVRLDVVAGNLASPVVLTHAGDGSRRLFIAEQGGQILIVDSNRALLPTPFLDLSGKMSSLAPPVPPSDPFYGFFGGNPGVNTRYDERGLLGLAFHPAYASNGLFYVYYSSPKVAPDVNHESIVAQYQVSASNANVAATNETVILRLDEPEFNHNGGALAFGPDGYLYIAFGDGGGAKDGLGQVPPSPHGPTGNAQNTSTWLGKILRIDVTNSTYVSPASNPFVGTDGADEIFAYGFRNPYRMSFDRGGAHELFVADVGQDLWEEVNIVKKGGNYGWRILEGRHAFDPPLAKTVGVDIRGLEFPIDEYSHAVGISVIGGCVYRGTNYPALNGRYVFGDFSTDFLTPAGHLFYLEQTRSNIWERFTFNLAPSNAPLQRFVKGFGEDEQGELYLLSSALLSPTGTTGTVSMFVRP